MANIKKLQSIISEIRNFCESNADEKQAQRYARYFTEGYDAYGVPKEIFVEKKTKLVEDYRDVLSLDDVLKLGEMLLQSGKYEEASFATLWIEAYQDQFTPDAFQKLGEWLEKGIRNWGHTDILCGYVLSRFFKKYIVQLEDMSSWRESSSKWKRRAVPVTMISLLKKSKNVKSLLDFIDPMMLDEDRFVHQGLGWFLREVWKRQPKPVESFLLKWKDSAPRKIFQYATEKLTKEEKEKYRRERKN